MPDVVQKNRSTKNEPCSVCTKNEMRRGFRAVLKPAQQVDLQRFCADPISTNLCKYPFMRGRCDWSNMSLAWALASSTKRPARCFASCIIVAASFLALSNSSSAAAFSPLASEMRASASACFCFFDLPLLKPSKDDIGDIRSARDARKGFPASSSRKNYFEAGSKLTFVDVTTPSHIFRVIWFDPRNRKQIRKQDDCVPLWRTYSKTTLHFKIVYFAAFTCLHTVFV